MANQFLASLSQSEHARVQDVAGQLTAGLKPWVQGCPVLNPVRLPAVALTLAAAAPSWDPAILQLLAKVTLWIFSIDDAIDEEQIPDEVLIHKVCTWRSVLEEPHRPPQVDGDEHSAVLAEIAAQVARSPFFEPLHAHWRSNFERMFAGMFFEREIGRRVRVEGPAALPSYSTYLEHGLYSVGALPFATSACMLRAEAGALEHWPAWMEMEREVGRTLRLANDLRTWAKEAREHNLNALMILQRNYAAGGMPAHAAWNRARLEATRHMALCHAHCRSMKRLVAARVPDTAAALVRTVDFAVEFYREHDYRTVPAEMIERL